MNNRLRPLARVVSLVCLVCLFGTTAIQTRAAAPPAPTAQGSAASPFGLNTHLATRYPDAGTIDKPLTLVDTLDVGWAREDFAWPRIESRPGKWDWGFTDKMVGAYQTHNVQILGRLGYSVGWATADPNDSNDGQSFSMPNLDAWSGYIAATVGRYKDRVQYWEIWNEPDNPLYWNGRPDPQAYAQLLRVAYDTIKRVDPGAKVLIGGVSPFDLNFLEGIARAGAWNAFDILSIHPYVDPVMPEQGQIGPSGVGGVRALLNRLGTKPIWATEFGWESGASQRNPGGKVNEDAQANALVRGYVQLLAEQGVERAFWYTMHDDRDSSFGLFRFGSGYADYSSPKPSYNAFRTMTRELADARFWNVVDLSSDRRVVESWEGANNWVQAGPANGALTKSADRAKDGGNSGRYEYRFGSGENDYVAFRPPTPLDLGQPGVVGLWVYGDNSGHLMQIQLEDQSGELLQFALGKVGGPEWSWMQASLGGEVLPGNRLGGGNNNGRLDGNVKVRALVVDDQPNEYIGSGTIWVDSLTGLNGPEAYNFRWQRDNTAIDVVFAPGGANVRIPTASTTARVVDRDGVVSELRASGGYLTLWADERPRYVHHTPGVPQTQPDPDPDPDPQPSTPMVPAAPDDAFRDVWNRSDAPVANGAASRSWLWGPASFATAREDYRETSGGGRVVQYWDKSRMEITNPGGNRSELWFVTNGLLTKELISGRLQIGNSTFVERAPAEVPIAGDPTNNTGPTYASFGAVASLNGDRGVAATVGAMVTARINRGGEITNDDAMRRYDVRIASYDPNLQHNIPTVFAEYFRTLPLDWVFAMGYPITEPYWTTVRVGGVEKDVLVQVFERRALTYTPSNNPAFQVEMGNVGQHYFRWRYGTTPWQQ